MAQYEAQNQYAQVFLRLIGWDWWASCCHVTHGLFVSCHWKQAQLRYPNLDLENFPGYNMFHSDMWQLQRIC
jgi:hypothetical protein